MAMRYRDNQRWKDPWYRALPSAMKTLWEWLWDDCDCSGVWFEDLEVASLRCGQEVTSEVFERWFGQQVRRLDDGKLLIKDYLKTQYPKGMSMASAPQRRILDVLRSHGVDPAPYLASPPPEADPAPAPDPVPFDDGQGLANPCPSLAEGLLNPCPSLAQSQEERRKQKEEKQQVEKQKAESREADTARACPEPGSAIAVDPRPTQALEPPPLDFAAPELAPASVAAVIDQELGLAAAPEPADPPAPPSNVIPFPQSRSGKPAEPVSAPPRAPDPPRGPAPATRTPTLPKPLPPHPQYAPAPPCRPLPQDGIDAGPEARRLFRDLWGAGYRPPRADQPVTPRPEEASA